MKARLAINATNIGGFLDGIGMYGTTLLKEFAKMQNHVNCIVYLNRSSAQHFRDITFPPTWSVRWLSKRLSPDYGFKGHLLRFLYAQWIGLRHWTLPVFATSQLEAILFRRNQVIMVHDLIPLLFKDCHRRQYHFFRHVLNLVLRRAIAVITPSQHTKGLLLHHYNLREDRVHVIPNGIHPALSVLTSNGQQKRAHNAERPYILFTGRIVRMKNITGMLRAFRMIKDRIPHTLVIVGYGRKNVAMEFERSRLASYGIEDHRVVFKGHVKTEEMHELMKKAAVLVFPSFYEGFGLPPVEAMACGCPVVVSNVASLPEICGDDACYVDPYVVEDIARGVLKVLTDSEFRKTLIEGGLKRARQFTAARSALRHVQLFNKILGTDVAPGEEAVGVVRHPAPLPSYPYLVTPTNVQ